MNCVQAWQIGSDQSNINLISKQLNKSTHTQLWQWDKLTVIGRHTYRGTEQNAEESNLLNEVVYKDLATVQQTLTQWFRFSFIELVAAKRLKIKKLNKQFNTHCTTKQYNTRQAI